MRSSITFGGGNRKSPPAMGGFQMQNEVQVLQLANILSSRALRALDNIETDTITLSQRFKTFSLDRRMMYEYVLATVLLDKTKSL